MKLSTAVGQSRCKSTTTRQQGWATRARAHTAVQVHAVCGMNSVFYSVRLRQWAKSKRCNPKIHDEVDDLMRSSRQRCSRH